MTRSRLCVLTTALLTLAATAASAATPVPISHFAERTDLGGGRFRLAIHSYPKHYRDGRGAPTLRRTRCRPSRWRRG